MRRLGFLATIAIVSIGVSARAYADEPEGAKPEAKKVIAAPEAKPESAPGDAEESMGLMRELTKAGLHEPNDERWQIYGQFNWMSGLKLAFHAPYTNLGGTTASLLPQQERTFTGTATVFLGLGLWPGAEIYAVPEIITERPLSGLKGLGSTIQNFELQKTGSVAPALYNSRIFLKQTFDFGGKRVDKPSGAMQLGRTVGSRRLVLSVGNFSVLDFLDKNSFSADLRRQFFNMTFLTHASYDFAADARGYTYGAVAELYFDDWAVRFSRIAPPRDPNQLSIDPRFFSFYGDQLELEHDHHIGKYEGVVRLLGYRNRENMGRFDEAVATFRNDPSKNATTCTRFNYENENPNAPDLCWVRRTNIKMGLGLNLEQHLPYDIGVFARGMYSDGQTEVYSFSSADRSLSFGTLTHGSAWHRPGDSVGVGYGQAWISKAHADFLNRGGIDGFIGDGKLRWASEHVLETFYSFDVGLPIWLTVDYQHIWHPAYNADRGPVNIFGARLHAEF